MQVQHRLSLGWQSPFLLPHVERRELMGGTLTSILLHYRRPLCRWEESYIDILLGPERTRKWSFEEETDRT